MKLLINNNTDLPLEVIGGVFDDYCKGADEITIYDGLVNKVVFSKSKKEYLMEITHHLKQVSIAIKESNVIAKKISTKGLKFPKIPRKKK